MEAPHQSEQQSEPKPWWFLSEIPEHMLLNPYCVYTPGVWTPHLWERSFAEQQRITLDKLYADLRIDLMNERLREALDRASAALARLGTIANSEPVVIAMITDQHMRGECEPGIETTPRGKSARRAARRRHHQKLKRDCR